jgi:hypothetical protein
LKSEILVAVTVQREAFLAETTFYQKFKANMDLLGAPCPESLFGTVATASATIGTIAKTIKDYGPRVTVRELYLTLPALASVTVGAGVMAEVAAVTGALLASLYLGCCIGSFLFATGQTLSSSNIIAHLTFPFTVPPDAWMYPTASTVLERSKH